MTAEPIHTYEPSSYAEMVAAEVRSIAAKKQVHSAELAIRLGISAMSMSRRMTGKLPFDVAELETVAVALGVEVRDLLPPVGLIARYLPSTPGTLAPVIDLARFRPTG